MQPINDTELLQLWEIAELRSPIEKSLLMLAFAQLGLNADQLAALSIGERDARLLRLRELMFGTKLSNTAQCPNCQQKVEWEMSTDALKMQELHQGTSVKTFEWGGEQGHFLFRLPNSTDILAISDLNTMDLKTRTLLQCCLVGPEGAFLPDDLPDNAIQDISMQMAVHDPQADIEIDLNCPNCTHAWPVVFDITQYLWQELNERAIRLLQEVYILAERFGWSEHEILTMSRRRRNLYLNMLKT